MSINYISMQNSILAICAKHESTIIFILLQIRKLRHRQVKEFAQGNTAGSGRARTGAQGTCLQRSCFPRSAPYVLCKESAFWLGCQQWPVSRTNGRGAAGDTEDDERRMGDSWLTFGHPFLKAKGFPCV